MFPPLSWEHHPVFLALPFMASFPLMKRSPDLLLFGFCYYIEYVVPAFDFFPLSFGRLISPLALAFLIHRNSRPSPGGSCQIDISRLSRWLGLGAFLVEEHNAGGSSAGRPWFRMR